jgi:hypothetical protein
MGLEVDYKKITPDGLYIAVYHPGYNGNQPGIRWNNGVSTPIPGEYLKMISCGLPLGTRFYPYPCTVTRGRGLAYSVELPASVPSKAPEAPATGLPQLPDLGSVALPETLPEDYRALLNRYRRYGSGYRLKDAPEI